MTQPIYRFKFSPDFQLALEIFANIHRLDETSLFRENWDRWYDSNTMLIKAEENRLDALGFKKNFKDKMYKSVRYYFKNKSLTKRKPRKRKIYIGLSQVLLDNMSSHIAKFIIQERMRPAYAYNNFIGNSEFNMNIYSEEQRLIKEFNMNEVDIEAKIKKTYKNRYFIYQKQNKKNTNE